MNEFPSCPKCASEYTYPQDMFMVCPDCGYEWDPNAAEVGSTDIQVLDANGTILQNGDSVIVLKNLPVKGAAKPVKAGTKVKSIKLVEGDHNIECKIEGFGSMALKSEFVRKA